jgi:hypothetical protein
MSERSPGPPSDNIAIIKSGDDIDLIRSAERALIFVSVPWSGPERKARKIFEEVANQLPWLCPDLRIRFVRLEIDENEKLQDWLISLGYPEFVMMGAGSLLWLEHGKVVGIEPTANCGLRRIVEHTMRLWDVGVKT